MTFATAPGRLALLLLLACVLNGCSPIGQSEVDEQKESHFLTGKNRAASMDYPRAVEAFEKALEVNPRSASAHLELGLLYEEKINDYAAAIHHFQKHLKLRPNSHVADMVRSRIMNCKFELAKTVPLPLLDRKVQATLDRLNSENTVLRQHVEELKAQIKSHQQLAQQARAAERTPPQAPQHEENRPSPPIRPTPTTPEPRATIRADATAPQRRPAAEERPAPAGRPGSVPGADARSAVPRIQRHTVRAGETVQSIAARYGTSQNDVYAGNIGLRQRPLRPGETINVPVTPR